jgi:hypothetical protein
MRGGGRPVDEMARSKILPVAKAGGLIGGDGHGRELQRLPVDRPPEGHLAVLLTPFGVPLICFGHGHDHLIGTNGIADADAADDPGADVLPQRL